MLRRADSRRRTQGVARGGVSRRGPPHPAPDLQGLSAAGAQGALAGAERDGRSPTRGAMNEVRTDRRKRVLYLYNVPDWAIHNVGRDWASLLSDTHEVT